MLEIVHLSELTAFKFLAVGNENGLAYLFYSEFIDEQCWNFIPYTNATLGVDYQHSNCDFNDFEDISLYINFSMYHCLHARFPSVSVVLYSVRSLYTKVYYTIMQVIAKIFTFSSNFLLSRDIEYSHLLTVLSFYQFASNLLACFLFTWSHISTDWRYLW